MIAQTIGWCAAGIALLCLVGLFAIRVLWPASDGQHAKKPHQAQHRDAGHEGAGSEGHAEELHQLGVDPPVTLVHRENCHDLAAHVPPIGFNLDESKWDGTHGESFLVGEIYRQCMCGHPDYLTCPDWLLDAEMGLNCSAGDHLCDGETFAAEPPHDRATCSCTCHDIPLSAAIKQQRRRQTGEMADLFGTDDEPNS